MLCQNQNQKCFPNVMLHPWPDPKRLCAPTQIRRALGLPNQKHPALSMFAEAKLNPEYLLVRATASTTRD